MITFKDFISLDELQKFNVGNGRIINIETREYQDKPLHYYRVWFLAKVETRRVMKKKLE